MKIALLTNGIWPYIMGGMQKHSCYLAKYLAQNRIYVDLYHYRHNSENDINIRNVFSKEELIYINEILISYPNELKIPGKYLISNYIYSKRIYKEFIKQDKVDFIYAKGFSGWYFIYHLKRLYPNLQMGVNFHGYEMFQIWPSFKAGIKMQILKIPVKIHLSKSDYLFSYGGKITDILKSLKVPIRKIIEIPTGIDSDWIENTTNTVDEIMKFVFIGRYERRKGIEEIIYTLNILAENNLKFEFHFIGPMPEEKKTKHSQIFYHGQITDIDQIKVILRSCDILVCPSYSEGMPNVILEAMASGCAILATDVGAVSEIANDKNGWLINAGSKKELLETMKQILQSSRQDIMKKKQASLDIVKNYTWDKIIKKTLENIEVKL